MKKFQVNLSYIGDFDLDIIIKILKPVQSMEGVSLESMSIEDVTKESEFTFPEHLNPIPFLEPDKRKDI